MYQLTALLLLFFFLVICCGQQLPPSSKFQERSEEEYRQVIDSLRERLERVEKAFNISTLNPDLDDMSYIEVFWEDLKRIAVNSIPPSDKECKFQLTSFSCQPKCSCAFQYVLGDYSFSRACRRRKSALLTCSDSVDRDGQHHERVQNSSDHRNRTSLISSMRLFIQSKLSGTDQECYWNLNKMQCQPKNMCSLQWKPNDFWDLNRACRLKKGFENDIIGEDPDPDPDLFESEPEPEPESYSESESESEGDYHAEEVLNGSEKVETIRTIQEVDSEDMVDYYEDPYIDEEVDDREREAEYDDLIEDTQDVLYATGPDQDALDYEE